MTRWIDIVSDRAWRERMGRRFESLTDEVFHVIRWATIVGFVQFLEIQFPSIGFTIARWLLSFFLFGYIASRFLLRPEIRFVSADASRWLRLLQFLLNFAICFIVFAAVLWVLQMLTATVAEYNSLR
jgi:signal transduction histidine kinase